MPIQEVNLFWTMTADERRAAAYYGLCKAAMKPSKNFVAYAQQAVRRQILEDCRMLHRVGSSGRLSRSVVFPSLPSMLDKPIDGSQSIDFNDELEATMKKLPTLSGIEYRVIMGTIEGRNIHQIAKSIGKRRLTAKRIQARARQKLLAHPQAELCG